jgi:hypothetical protein
MRDLWRALRTNLLAGTRLALFLPVRAADFRVSAGNYAMVVLFSFAMWLLGGIVRGGWPGAVNVPAFVAGLGQLPLVLLACLLAAVLVGDAALALAFAVLITSTDPVFEVVSMLLVRLTRVDALALYGAWLNQAFVAWGAIVLLRAQYLVSGWKGARSVGAALIFLGLLMLFLFWFPRAELWSPVAQEAPAPQGLMREDVFHAQAGLLGRKIFELEPERPGVADVYFVGVAPYALQDTFLRELVAVKRLMDERFDTAGRSLMLANHQATLSTVPLATSTNLGEAIGSLGELVNPDEDILFLFLTTHGTREHELSFTMPPLGLNQVNPTLLSRMLADSGIKWRVIVISACYSGGFIEALKDENTLILTAADAKNSSFGCEPQSEFTWFSRAFFNEALRDQALRGTYSFVEAFEKAKETIAAQEKSQGLEPSNPQMHLGGAMKQKLETLRQRLESR